MRGSVGVRARLTPRPGLAPRPSEAPGSRRAWRPPGAGGTRPSARCPPGWTAPPGPRPRVRTSRPSRRRSPSVIPRARVAARRYAHARAPLRAAQADVTGFGVDRSSAAVAHSCVLHAEDVDGLVPLETRIDDLPDEKCVPTAVDGVADLAVQPGHGLVEHGRAGPGVVEGETVERAGRGVVLDGLGELADDRPVVAGDRVEREHPPVRDQLMGERGLLDAA